MGSDRPLRPAAARWPTSGDRRARAAGRRPARGRASTRRSGPGGPDEVVAALGDAASAARSSSASMVRERADPRQTRLSERQPRLTVSCSEPYNPRFCASAVAARPFLQSDVAVAARGRQTRSPEDPCTQSSRPAGSSTASRSAPSSRSSSSTSSRARRSPSIASCSSPTATTSTIGRPLVADAVGQRRGRQPDPRPQAHLASSTGPKARSRVKKGHRQELTVLRIADITLGGKSAAKAAKQGRRRGQDRAASARGGRRRAGRQGRRARREARGRGRGADARRRRPAKADGEDRAGGRSRPKTGAEGEGAGDQDRQPQGRQADRDRRPRRSKAAAPKADADAKADASRARPPPKRTRATKKDE